MISIDTNILVRFLVKDDKKQAEAAAGIISSQDVFITKTVFLESEWVLLYVYKFKPEKIIKAFRNLLGLSNIFTEDFHILSEAISLAEKGLDFADALHVTSSRNAEFFMTFDKSLASKAGKINIPNVRLPRK